MSVVQTMNDLLQYIIQTTHHTSNNDGEELSRDDFMSLRCCALQWAYLDAMTTKAFKQQEDQADAQMYQLHSSLMKTKEENKALENEIATIEHQMAVDATLHSQVCLTLMALICTILCSSNF